MFVNSQTISMISEVRESIHSVGRATKKSSESELAAFGPPTQLGG